jgi:predicted RNA-binding protein with PUA-like domain
MKSEPNVYSIEKLKEDEITHWEGVRNYQARNFMRDEMKKGDLVFFYHSNTESPGIAGIAEVSKEGYPDPFQFDPKSKYFDAKSQRDKPRWFLVDLRFKKKFKNILSLSTLKEIKALEEMPLLQRGQRLSVQPVNDKEWNRILEEIEE